jgi:hypothetical protein
VSDSHAAVIFIVAVLAYVVMRWRRKGKSVSGSINDFREKFYMSAPRRRDSFMTERPGLWGAGAATASSRGGQRLPKRTNSEMIDELMQNAYAVENGTNDMESEGYPAASEKTRVDAFPPPPPPPPPPPAVTKKPRTISAWIGGLATPRFAGFPRSDKGMSMISRPKSIASLSSAPTLETLSCDGSALDDEPRPPKGQF